MTTDADLSGIRPAKYVHNISFRVDDTQATLAADLRSTFPQGSWAEVGRWLLSEPEVVAAIHKRIRGER